jgi:hypothetical protein
VEVNNPGKRHIEILNGHYIGGKEIERKKDKLSRRRGLSSHYPKIMQLPILLIACLRMKHQLTLKALLTEAFKAKPCQPLTFLVNRQQVTARVL